MRLSVAGATHVGQVRAVNEDAWFAGRRLAVIADGMGGHARGDVASAIAIAVLQAIDDIEHLTVEHVLDGVRRANEAIAAEGAADPIENAMGTTMTGIAGLTYAGTDHWLVFNIGDSRVYRVQDDRLEQLTTDHSEVAELVAAGRITAEQARTHPLRNVVTRSLGIVPGPRADTWIFPRSDADYFLLCSDGLVNELSDQRIFEVLATEHVLEHAASALVFRAVEAGGRDNVTAILVRGVATDSVYDDTDSSTAPRATALRGTT